MAAGDSEVHYDDIQLIPITGSLEITYLRVFSPVVPFLYMYSVEYDNAATSSTLPRNELLFSLLNGDIASLTFAKLAGTWRDVMQTANRAMAMDFLEYLCQTCRMEVIMNYPLISVSLLSMKYVEGNQS